MKGLNQEQTRYRNAVLIYNPFAGRLARRKHLLQRSIEALGRTGIAAQAVATSGPNSAGGLARSAVEEGADLVICAGGDGTLNEVANGMIGSAVPMALLPAGTANVLAHELQMKGGLEEAAQHLHTMVPTRLSAGVLRNGNSERYFLLMAGAGLDAQIVYDLNLDLKAAIGKLAYYAGGFSQVFQPLPQFEVELNNERRRCGFALVSRVRNYGGDLEIARRASLLRSDFEVVLFEGSNPLRYLGYLAAVAMGRTEGLKGVTVTTTESITCHSPEDSRIYTQIDGEIACPLPVTIESVADALTLLVPRPFLEREQALHKLAECV